MKRNRLFLDTLDSIQEQNGQSLLDNTVVVIGTNSNDLRHRADRIPYFIAGGKGLFRHGEYINARGDHSRVGVYRSVLRAMGIDPERHKVGADRSFRGFLPIEA